MSSDVALLAKLPWWSDEVPRSTFRPKHLPRGSQLRLNPNGQSSSTLVETTPLAGNHFVGRTQSIQLTTVKIPLRQVTHEGVG